MTSYETVFNKFLIDIEDPLLPKLNEEERTEMLIGYMDKAINMISFEKYKLDNDLSDRDNDTEMFNVELSDMEIALVSAFMVVAWYNPKINSLQATLYSIGYSDSKNQQAQVKQMISNREYWRKEAKRLYNNYKARVNSYLGSE